MAGRIEERDGERVFVHEAAGFSLVIPEMDASGTVEEVAVPDGPTLVNIRDDWGQFIALYLQVDLGGLSVEDWLDKEMELSGLGQLERLEPVSTAYGEALLFAQPASEFIVAVLMVDDRVVYMMHHSALADYAEYIVDIVSGEEPDPDVAPEFPTEDITEFLLGFTLLDK